MTSRANPEGKPAVTMIEERIASLGDWRGKTLARMRALIKEEDPNVVEEWKWMGTPVWEHDGIITTGESYKAVVKLTFAKGAFLRDPKKLFNSSLEGNLRRAIDIHENEELDATAFKALVREAIELNTSGRKPATKPATKSATKTAANATSKSAKRSATKAAAKSAKRSATKTASKPAKKAGKKSAKKPAKRT